MSTIKKHIHLLLILLIAILLRLPHLNGSFWLDEAAQALESSRPFSQQLEIAHDFQPPLLHYLVHFALYLGKSEWWLRTVGALIPGLLTIAGAYVLAKQMYGEKVAVIASVLLMTNSFHIFYSQELRPYSLPSMFAVWSWIALMKIRSKKEERRNYRTTVLSWLPYINLTILGLYSSYLYPFLIPAQFLYVLLQEIKRKKTKKQTILNQLNRPTDLSTLFHSAQDDKKINIKEFLLANVVSGLTFLPWVPFFLNQLKVGQQLRMTLPTWETVVSIPQLKALPLLLGKFTLGVIQFNQDSTTYISVGLLIATLLTLFNKKLFKKTTLTSLQLPFIWFVLPVLFAWLTSFFVPVVRPKRFLIVLPALYLGFGILNKSISAAKEQNRVKKNNIAFLLLLTLNLFSTYQYYTNPQLQRENWRDLINEIQENYPKEQSVAVFSYPAPFSPWDWYADPSYPTVTTGQVAIDRELNLDQRIKSIYDKEYVLVFDYLRDLTDPEDKLIKEIENYGFSEVGALDYPNIGLVRIFVKSKELKVVYEAVREKKRIAY